MSIFNKTAPLEDQIIIERKGDDVKQTTVRKVGHIKIKLHSVNKGPFDVYICNGIDGYSMVKMDEENARTVAKEILDMLK